MPYLRQLPSKKWQATYRDARGNRHSITRATKVQARDEALEAESQLRRGAWIDPDLAKITFSDWHDIWWKARVAEASTKRKNRSTLDNHVIPAWGTVPLDQIRNIEVRAWIAEMIAAGVGAETIGNAHQLLAMVIDAAVVDGRLQANRARPVNLPTVSRQPDRYTTDAEVDRIVAAILDPTDKRKARHPQDARMVRFTHRMGLRWAEVAGLHIHRIDLGRRELHVVEVATRSEGIKEYPKSRSSFRTLPFTDSMAKLLKEQIAGRTSGLLFPGEAGDPLSYTNWRRRVWVRAVVAAKISAPAPTFHDLRHTCASNLVEDGMDLASLREFMGHESIATTNRYVHSSPSTKGRIRAVLAARDAPVTHGVANLAAKRARKRPK